MTVFVSETTLLQLRTANRQTATRSACRFRLTSVRLRATKTGSPTILLTDMEISALKSCIMNTILPRGRLEFLHGEVVPSGEFP